MIKYVLKRDNATKIEFMPNKIRQAIQKANTDVPVQYRIDDESISKIIESLEITYQDKEDETLPVEEIQDFIEVALMSLKKFKLARKYITYRYSRALIRKANTTDDSILQLVNDTNDEVARENSNKKAVVNSTKRDLIAGEVSKDLTRRLLLPKHIVEAHDKGILHFHDMDYFLQNEFNCCLPNFRDMLENGTAINGVAVETPKSFRVACTQVTQIMAGVSSNQYGGQTFYSDVLGKYLAYTREKFRKSITEDVEKSSPDYLKKEDKEKLIEARLETELYDELKAGVQTIQYQINTLMTTNGQSPFVTIFMYLRKDDPYKKENAMIIEEILKQRIDGVKNKYGVAVTPTFPKLIYVLTEENHLAGGDYDYLTRLAVKCSAKRMYPDYISEKIMKENYDGEVFGCMGCVQGDELITYKLNGELYIESFKRMWKRLVSKFGVKRQPIKGNHFYIEPEELEMYDTKLDAFKKVSVVIQNWKSTFLQVTLSNGRTLTCTEDHPFTTENRGNVQASDLIANEDKIRIGIDQYSEESIEYNDPDTAWFLGATICDGTLGGSVTAYFGFHDEDDIIDKYASIIENRYGYEAIIKEYHRGSKGDYIEVKARKSTDLTCELIEIFGGEQKKKRQIPNDVFKWDRESKIAFLAGMIDADGYYNKHKTHTVVQIGSTNKELAHQQAALARCLGMPARVYINYYSSEDPTKVRYRIEFIATKELTDAMVCEKKKANFVECSSTWSMHNNEISTVTKIEKTKLCEPSYDVTTESEHFEVSGIYSHNCRSFLSAWVDPKSGEKQWEGRFNQGVVTLNLPQIALASNKDENTFWQLMEERLSLCHEALMCRHKALLGTKSDVSPIHWQDGAIARLEPGETIDSLLKDGYSTISLGYIGLYECTKYMTGYSHTEDKGREFSLRVMNRLRAATDSWKAASGIGFGLYGTPAESTCYTLCK